MKPYYRIERHEDPKSMLLESLDEALFTVNYCLSYRKNDPAIWPLPHSRGILGMPAAIILFIIVDSIGSYYRKHETFEILIDGKKRKINKEKEHFFILNSEYFKLSLTESELENIYVMGRSKLVHNLILGKEFILIPSNNDPFIVSNDIRGKGRFEIHLMSFYQACVRAVEMFKENINQIVPNSTIGKAFQEKR